ncbi:MULTISPECIES: arginine--tRNA ligase [Prochlorococcus]|uniref:Arginine--tRNA ligase n=1 Tax=Prochlorococcus marinus (strain SARG / CCMP1375 / SS120) TaxID=167539 RepID=SYR_PROMA|nr:MULTISPECIES: arginine--tRNA ligase [Prochlorococcus]Q7VE03.1 RecName: Full=Arginine--tRNA ligase; AltName: Full=Arginyl-tRNA synthetase; Short=ArgRS [Prochlorococcus marinus subsp. marinus str. CCMP1375]AAP99258.1 Arginyl-tRNA synthetase [Prochlorococcus marinus subsp. marinus str. CCMP1375]KGG11473.1 Arginyl-tRNA synthetase [Prochlorococcus marinus str. LG]KGG18573.1 Arginyl-tRNA synthetase [Prochlorococcus marinus str. SS2]KGG22846.1 Arginyl-tRNA synthetase [Prochlorococcus marinus str. 
MYNIYKSLNQQVQRALNTAFPEAASQVKESGDFLNPQLVAATKPEFGDFQINGALALARIIKKSPRQIAEILIKQLESNEVFKAICLPPEIAGPGFINLTLQNTCLINEITSRLNDDLLGVPLVNDDEITKKLKPVIVDFSSPNIAKEMHVGHLRSTIIGDSIARILNYRGYKVIRLNHVGDWGTQFGMLITHLKEVAPKALTTANVINLGNLVEFYKKAKQRFDEDEYFQQCSRNEVVNLQRGNKESLKAWELLCEQSRKEFNKIYDRLKIEISERGESFYNPFLQGVIDDLTRSGLLVEDDGAKCVFLNGINGKDGNPLPLIIQKADGGFNYATTDLAAIRYRLKDQPDGDGAGRIIYVTDSGQANHFAGVFQVAKRAKWLPSSSRIEHVPFGLVQGEDGKKLKTRSGETVRLKDLLDEAISRAKLDIERRLNEENRKESQAFIEKVSNTIGIAAVKYADLSQNRITNYQFSFDRMLALQGNTAPYLLYAVVRIAGINRKGGDLHSSVNKLNFSEPQEWRLIRELLKFDEVIIAVEEELLPNRLCNYLFELSQVFNRFYDQIPVLKAEEPSRSCRLALCQLTGDTLKKGLNLLGISTLERM